MIYPLVGWFFPHPLSPPLLSRRCGIDAEGDDYRSFSEGEGWDEDIAIK